MIFYKEFKKFNFSISNSLKIILLLLLFGAGFLWSSDQDLEELSFGEENNSNLGRMPASRRSKGMRKGRALLPKGHQTFKKIRKKALLKYIKPPAVTRLYFPEGTDEAELEKITNMEIKQLYKLFKKSNRPDIQLRLASLYVEMSRLIESRIYETHTEQMELYSNKKRNTPPKLNLSSVKNYSQKAINLFQIYLQKNPKSKRADDVLFQLGYSYFQIGKPDQGKKYYERLIRQFKRSPQLEDAYFHLGEYYFDTRNWKLARINYDKASKFNSKFYSFSIYKIAWCFYNEGKVEKAMDFMVRVIKDSKQFGQVQNQRRFSFSREALNDLSSFYIYSKYSPNEAYSFFSRVLDEEERRFKAMEKLAYAYKDIGSNQGLRHIFSLLIKLDPYNPQAYDYKYQIVQAYSYSENRKIFNKEFYEWLRDYGKGSTWSKKNRSNSDLVTKAFNLMEVTLRNYTFRMHHSFSKTKSKYSKNQSFFGYQSYVQYFPDSKFAPDIWFHYGEFLFDLGKFKDASKKYKVIVQKYPKSKQHEVAALNRVLALEKVIPKEKEVAAMVKKSNKAVAFPEVINNLEESIQQYMRYYPRGKKIPNMMYLIANLHLEFKHYDKALDYWMRIVRNYSKQKSDILVQSVHSILDVYNLKKDYESLKKISQMFLQNSVIRSLPVAGEIREILRQIKFKEAQQMAQRGRLKLSAKLYESFAKENRGSKLAVLALYNASLNYKKVKNLSKAINLYTTLYRSSDLKNHPKIKYQMMKDLPDLYQKTGQYLKAAQSFEAFAVSYPKDKSTSGFWYNSGIIFDGLHLHDKAVSSYLRYYNSTKSADRNQIYYFIGKIRQREGKLKMAIGNYSKYISSPGGEKLDKMRASFQIAQINKSLNVSPLNSYKKTVQLYRKFNQGVSFAAQSQFQLTYQVYRDFKNIRIPSQSRAQASAMKKKLNLLETLKNQIKNVIRFDYGPEVISSLTLIGLANRHLSEVILKSPLPRGLNKSQKEQYKSGLKKTAQPFSDSANRYFDQAVKKASKTRGYIPWLKEAEKEIHLSSPSSIKFEERIYSMEMEGF